jgi:ATP-dependent Lon protease
MNELDQKINNQFPGLVVRKDLVKIVKGNAIVPSYVLEYLLGQYCASNDETTIQTGIEVVKEILRKHYVHRNEAGLVRSNIKEKGRCKVIDMVSVSLNDKIDAYEAEFFNLGIKKVLIDADTVKSNQKLLVGGVWCIADIEYDFNKDNQSCPWILAKLKPIQISHFDFEKYQETRKHFTTDEWTDLIIQSIGFNPAMFGKRSKLIQLIRLIPFCERNYNLLELGPKGTGKSHIYSEFSPHGTLVSGGETTQAKLFINNTTGKIGLVGYWDVVAMDEFSGRNKKPDAKLIDTLKNYMANKSFNRGTGPQGAEASMVFVGNTTHNVPFMLKHGDLFYDLPEGYRNSEGQAILDRLYYYIPGWEMDNLRNEMFSDGYGFVIDYLAEILRALRSHDYSDRYKAYFTLSPDLSSRDRDGIQKTFSGLMKILFPDGEATKEEIEELLRFSMEGRKRIKDQIQRIDETYAKVHFSYQSSDKQTKAVITLEEEVHPNYYHKTVDSDDSNTQVDQQQPGEPSETININAPPQGTPETLKPKHLIIQENQKGISYDNLFGNYLEGVTKIAITDPYVRLFYQIRNLMEFVETITRYKAEDEEVSVHLITAQDEFNGDQQQANLEKVKESADTVGVTLTWEFDENRTAHARHIITDTGWKIILDRGLDIFQRYEMNDAFNIANRLQQFRPCKSTEITYLRVEE